MTNEEIIDVVSRAKYHENGDCINVECRSHDSEKWVKNVKPSWNFYSSDYRIMEPKRIVITKDLRGKWFRDKYDNKKTEYAVTAIDYDSPMIYIDDEWYKAKELNERWELVD